MATKKIEKPQILNGVIQVTGEHDTGKTTFALECGAAPEKILFLDDDLKGRATVQELENAGVKFGRYVDLVALGDGKAELDYHNAVMKVIQEIKPGEFDAIIWDTWTHFANTTHAYVLTNPTEFKKNWAPMGTIKGAQQWQEARRYEAKIISYLQTLAPTVILVTHLKDQYMGKVKVPGKQVPANSNALDRVLRFRIWLRLNPTGRAVPIGLCMKRLDKKHVQNGVIRTVNVLPRKLVPADTDLSLWDTIWKYWQDPMGDRVPTDEELPTEYELSILDGTLTRDQTHTLRTMVASGLLEQPEEESNMVGVDQEKLAVVIDMVQEGKPVPAIAKAVELSVTEVQRYIDALPGPAKEVEFEGHVASD
jgi:hypothetical protein